MSEYQYYEFLAVDGPISDEGVDYAKGCSSRAEVSRMSWRNVYHFGDFHGSVDRLLLYYDAHFYIANWASVTLAFSFRKECLDQKAIAPYLSGGREGEITLGAHAAGDRLILSWEQHVDGGWTSEEGDGVLDDLLEIREELLRNDFRALFLGWLTDFCPEEWSGSERCDVHLPPVPDGLENLSSALKELMHQFSIDPDLVAVAAGLSGEREIKTLLMDDVLAVLSSAEMRRLLKRVAKGEGANVMRELKRMSVPDVTVSQEKTITCVEFANRVLTFKTKLRKKAERAAEAKRVREAAVYKKHLKAVMKRADSIWDEVNPLMEAKNASSYDVAAQQIIELRAAYCEHGKESDFRDRLEQFRKSYSRRPAMMRRIENL